MGDPAPAEPMLREERVAIGRKALGANHPDYAQSLYNLAGLYHNMGDFARTQPLFIEALAVISRFTQGTSSVLGERQQLRLYQDRRRALDAYLNVGRRTGTKPADLYRQVLDWKGAAEARHVEARLARDQPESRPHAWLDSPGLARGSANVAFRPPPAGQGEAWRQQLHKLREAKEDLEADLARQSHSYRGQKQAERREPDEVATALPGPIRPWSTSSNTPISARPRVGRGRFRGSGATWRSSCASRPAGGPCPPRPGSSNRRDASVLAGRPRCSPGR